MDHTAGPLVGGGAAGPDDLGDAAIARRAQAGDPSAFAQLLRRHGAALRRTAMRRVRHPADADDVVQEAVLQAWQRLPQLREPAAVRTWMLQIADREALRWSVARRQDHELTDEVALIAGPDADVDRFDLHDGLRAVLGGLPDHLAQVWLLREADGCSYREIAHRLGVEESTVRSRLVTVRKHVQRALRDHRPPRVASPFDLGAVAAPQHPPVKSARATFPPAAGDDPVAGLQTRLHQDRDLAGPSPRPEARRERTGRAVRPETARLDQERSSSRRREAERPD